MPLDFVYVDMQGAEPRLIQGASGIGEARTATAGVHALMARTRFIHVLRVTL